jgi:hypothetical protein
MVKFQFFARREVNNFDRVELVTVTIFVRREVVK